MSRISKFTYSSFIHIACAGVTQNALTSTSEARRLHVSFNILPEVSCLFSFFSLSTSFKKLLLVEYPSFGDEGIQKILYTWLQILQLVSEQYRQTWVLLQSSIGRPSPSRFPRTEEDNLVVSSSLLFNSSNNDTPNLSLTSGFISPNDQSQWPVTTTAAAATTP